jgi:hypothetical protein
MQLQQCAHIPKKLTELLQNLSATLEGDVEENLLHNEVKKVLLPSLLTEDLWCF